MSGASSSYDGGKDVYPPAGIIYVTISYRLNAFGFFKPANAKNGHYEFRDQQLALKWVKANIKNFGGDPNRVTISGQSAGKTSILNSSCHFCSSLYVTKLFTMPSVS